MSEEQPRNRRTLKIADVDWDLKRPCKDCPFKKSSPFHEGVAAGCLDLMNMIEDGVFAHTCHKTDDRSDSKEGKRWPGRVKHCVGSLYMLIKSGEGKDLQRPLLQAIANGQVDVEDLTRRALTDEECFTLSEFLAFCGDGLRRLWEREANDL